MANDWGKVETVKDFVSLGSKIAADCNCSHEIKRRLLLGRKAITTRESILKSKDITFSSVQSSCSVMSDYLRPHGLQHTRLPCPSLTPGAYSNSCPLSWWCHPTISSSVIPFSSCLQSCPTSGPFQMSQFFTSGGQSFGVSASASILPMTIQDWFPSEWTGWIFLQSKGVSRVFSNTTVQKHQFFSVLSSQPNSLIHRWPQEKP